jgi:hypothetical protein
MLVSDVQALYMVKPREAAKALESLLSDFEADVRADERVKATAETYERIGKTMAPRGLGES